MRNIVKLLVELDGRLGRSILEATQASGLYVQHLSYPCHVAGALAQRPPNPDPRRISQQTVDQVRPLQPPLPGHRSRIDPLLEGAQIPDQHVGVVPSLVQ
jgi:hypothetical protein